MPQKTIESTPLQGRLLSVLLGSMLGDGSLKGAKETASFVEGHATDQKEYLLWKADLWGDRISNIKEQPPRKSTHQSSITISTKYTKDLHYWWDLFYGSSPISEKGYRHKLFPQEVIHMITPLALAIWYMDDGGLVHWPIISCHERNHEVGLKILAEFGIVARPFVSQSSRLIIEGEEQAKLFLSIVKPHIHPTLSYKIEMPFLGLSEQNKGINGKDMIEAINKGATILDLCEQFGVGKQAIRSKLLELGLTANNTRPLLDADWAHKVIKEYTGNRPRIRVPKEVLEELIELGLNFRQIQGKLGISHRILERQYQEHGLSLEQTRGKLGGCHNIYKHLTKDRIAEELNKGKNYKDTALALGCGVETLRYRIREYGLGRIKGNKVWRINTQPEVKL